MCLYHDMTPSLTQLDITSLCPFFSNQTKYTRDFSLSAALIDKLNFHFFFSPSQNDEHKRRLRSRLKLTAVDLQLCSEEIQSCRNGSLTS